MFYKNYDPDRDQDQHLLHLQIKSGVNNIKQAPVKISPMVGDGPHEDQRFCFYQYESGTRTIEPRMSVCTIPCDGVINPIITDPCLCNQIF